MRSLKAFAVFLIAVTLLVACGRKPAPPAVAIAALDRPLLTLDVKASDRILVPQAALVERGMDLQCTIQDGQVWFTDGAQTVLIEPRRLNAGKD